MIIIEPRQFKTYKFRSGITFTSGDKVRSIANDFLKQNDLLHFSYLRHYDDNSVINLTTHPHMAYDFYDKDFYKTIQHEKTSHQQDSTIVLWNSLMDGDYSLAKYYANYYHIGNGINIFKRQNNFTEAFCFGASSGNYRINNFYMAYLDEIYNFCYFFKERAKTLILQAEKKRFKVSDYSLEIPEQQFDIYPPYKQHIHIEKPMFKKMYYNGSYNQSITKREYQCLSLIARGYQAKQISTMLALTERTVNSYLTNLKTKLNLNYKSDLVDFYQKLF